VKHSGRAKAVEHAVRASVSLEELLDRLHVALEGTPFSLALPAARLESQGSLLEALRAVLEAVNRHSPGSIVPAPGLHSEFGDAVDAALRAWRKHVARALGQRKIAAAEKLLAGDAPDFMGILDVADDENRHSAALRWLLDPHCAPTIAGPALLALVARLDDPKRWAVEIRRAIDADALSVHREYTIAYEWTEESRLDRIDLVVSSPRFVLAIENKVRAKEHGEQTRRYWDWLSGLPLTLLRAGIFLSPSGFPPASDAFRALSYLELFSCLLEGPLHSTPALEEHLFLSGYTKNLAAGILRSELRAISDGGPNQ
jgi:hypothetical protein